MFIREDDHLAYNSMIIILSHYNVIPYYMYIKTFAFIWIECKIKQIVVGLFYIIFIIIKNNKKI